ncbi:BTAD domain-containing putative transcriptional regulator [Nocardioides sp. SYSU DS0651]|uniref:BTAD domain-containing putative transcriptional regulator n=1 Tax=Nocardioides sp. SYSU DS0651 TaxID=3415955 RepID=UPI003F4C8D3D
MASVSRADALIRRTAADRIALPAKVEPAVRIAPYTGTPDVPGLVRGRLNRRLDQVTRSRITVVVGPAGVGKTTAVAHWAKTVRREVVWWRARVEPCHPHEQAIRGLAQALHPLRPGPPRPTSRDALLDRLQQYDGAPVVVIDDFHHVDTPDVARLLEDLVDASDVRLVVISRTEPGLNLARSELPSAMLDMNDLRFREPETTQLFSSVYDEPLHDDDAWHLTHRTAGFAAALHLFHQTTRGVRDRRRRQLLRDFPTGATLATDYVARVVLDGLDESELRLLRITSPFETLTPARCSDVLDEDGVPSFRDLVRRGLLRQGPAGHGLPRFVRRQLLDELRDELGAAQFAAHVRRCADRMVAEGEAGPAVRAYVSVGDWAAASVVLDGAGPTVLADPDLEWTDAPCVEEAWRRLGRAVREVRAGRLERALAELGADPVGATAALRDMDARLRRFVRVWVDGDLTAGAEWFERLRASLHRPDPRRYAADPPEGRDDSGRRLLQAVESAVAGDFVAARRAVDTRASDDLATLWLAGASALAGTPVAVDRVVDEAELRGVPWMARIVHGIAEPESLPHLLAQADRAGDRWGALLLAGARAVLGLRGGAPSTDAFDDLVARCRSVGAPALEAWARSGSALAAACTGSLEAEREADLAVAFAHAAQVPGALAVAWGVLGRLRGDAGLLTDAVTEAERIGLGCRPWEWIADPSQPSGAAVVAERPLPLEVRCFDGFDISIDGHPPRLAGVRPRARALLRMLALHAGTPVHRELLVNAMWPQLDASAGTHNLHVCVSSLRTALEPGVARGASRLLLRDGDRYCLALPAGSAADLRDFDAATREAEECRTRGDVERSAAALERALLLYRGDVLPEDGPSEWVVGVRDRYRVRAAEAAALLAELRLAAGRAEEGAVAAQRSIDIEPCRDGSWRLLIKAYEAGQDLAAAERARQSYAAVLASLGVVESTAELVRTGRP